MTEEQKTPAHVAIIPDGNRRWAKERGLHTFEGHSKGSEAFRDTVLHAFDRGVKYLTAWAFSTENWSRAAEEIDYLMNLLVRITEKYLDSYHKAGIKVIAIGHRERLEKKVIEAIERVEAKTKDNTRGILLIGLNYGGQEEIVDAVRNIVNEGIPADEITAETIAKSLYAPEVPPVDLIIRTSGEQRTSGFMLFRAAYSELYFVDKYWPDFTSEDFDAALAEYARRERRFGS